MIEWKEYKLGDFIKVKHGYAFRGDAITTEETSLVLVTPGNFNIGGGYKSDKIKYFEGEFPEEYLLKEGDIVVTMTDLSKDTDTLGYSAKIPKSFDGKKYLHNQRIGLVQPKSDDVCLDFIYWVMRSQDYRWFIVGSASGTSVMHTSPTRIEEFEFSCPPLEEQRAIASILSSLDDKIDLLHRQNETLEKIAETLFRQWFIEEAQDDWEEGVLKDEFLISMGQSPPGSSYNEDGYGMPMYQGNADFDFRFPRRRIYTTESKRIAQPYDTLISVRAPVGELNMAYEPCCIGRGVASIRYSFDENVKEFSSYTYYKIKSLQPVIKQYNDEGTVFGSASKKDLENIEILLPPINMVKKFVSFVIPIDSKIINNTIHIRNLEQLRNLLLPKLMSGEIEIVI